MNKKRLDKVLLEFNHGDLKFEPDKWGGRWVRRKRNFAFNEAFEPDPVIERMRGAWAAGTLFDKAGGSLFKLRAGIGEDEVNGSADVAKLETLLDRAGHSPLDEPEGPTGLFATFTEPAIRAFQQENNLAVDGRVMPGGETIRALQAKFAPKAPARATPPTPTPHRRLGNDPPAETQVAQAGPAAPGATTTTGQGTKVGGATILIVSTKVGPPTNQPVDAKKMYGQLKFDPKGQGQYEVFVADPISGLIASDLSDDAIDRTQKRFKEQPLGNSQADAFRHALWSVEMTRRLGAEDAKKFADAHERSVPNANPERLMDLYNNDVGRSLALDPKNKGRPAEDLVMETLKTGKLQVQPFRVPTGSGKTQPRSLASRSYP